MPTLSYQLHALQSFLMDEAWMSISPFGSGQLVKMLIIIEPHGTFGSNFAYLLF